MFSRSTIPQPQPPDEIDLDSAIEQLRSKFKIPKVVVDRMVTQESGGRTDAVSPVGARGRFQVMPDTLNGISRQTGKRLNNDDPLDNAYAGLYLLKQNYDKFRQGAPSERGAWMRAVAAYHAGAGNVEKDLASGGVGIPDVGDGLINTRDHVYNIFSGTKAEDFGLDADQSGAPEKTPQVTSSIKELDSGEELLTREPSKPAPLTFSRRGTSNASLNPVETLYNVMDDKEIQPSGIPKLQSREYQSPASREIGDRVKIPFTEDSSEETIINAYLGTLGPNYQELGKRFKHETGQNILSLQGAIRREDDGSLSVRPSRGAIDFLNAYAEGGLDKALPLAERQRQEFIAAQNKAAEQAKPYVDRAKTAVEVEKQSPVLRGVFTGGSGAVQAAGTLLGPAGSDLRRGAEELRAVGEEVEKQKPLAELSRSEQAKYGAGALIPTGAALLASRGFGAAQLPALGALQGQNTSERVRGALEGAAMQTVLGPIPRQLGQSLTPNTNKALAGTALTAIPAAQQVAQGEPLTSAVIQNAPFAVLPFLSKGKQKVQLREGANATNDNPVLPRIGSESAVGAVVAERTQTPVAVSREVTRAQTETQPNVETQLKGAKPAVQRGREVAEGNQPRVSSELEVNAVRATPSAESVRAASARLSTEGGSGTSRWQHRDFGLVSEAENQTGVGRGRVRVADEAGVEHVIQRPKGTGEGNQIAIPVREAEVARQQVNQVPGEVAEMPAVAPKGKQYKPDIESLTEYRKYVEGQQRERDIDQTIALLENKESGDIYDRFTQGTATQTDIQQFRKFASELGVSREHAEDLIASARSVRIPSIAELSKAEGREAITGLKREANYLEQERSGLPSRIPPKEQFTDDLARRFNDRRQRLYRRVMSLMTEEDAVVNRLWNDASGTAKQAGEIESQKRLSQLTEIRDKLKNQVRSREELEDLSGEVSRLKQQAQIEYDQLPRTPETLIAKEVAHRKYMDLLALEGEVRSAQNQIDTDVLSSLEWESIKGTAEDLSSALRGREVKDVTPIARKQLSATPPPAEGGQKTKAVSQKTPPVEPDIPLLTRGKPSVQEAASPETASLPKETKVAPAREIDPSDYINLRKLNISEAEKANLGNMVKQVVSEGRVPSKERVTFEDIKREAAELDPNLVRNLKPPKRGETLDPAVRFAARERLNTLNAETVRLQKDLDAKRITGSTEEIDQLETRLAQAENDAKGVLDVLIPTRSQDGRNLAFHRMMAQQSFDADYWLSKARRVAERSGEDVTSKRYLSKEGRIRSTLAAGRDAETRLAQLEKQVEELRVKLERADSGEKPVTSSRPFRQKAESLQARLDTAAEQAKLRLKERLDPSRLHDITDVVSAIPDLAIYGAAKFARKGISAAVWAEEMAAEFGDSVKPHLKAIYKEAYSIYENESKTLRETAQVQRVTGGEPKTQAEIDVLLRRANDARKEVSQNRAQLARTFASLEKTGVLDTVSAVRKAGLLSGVKTHLRNVGSTSAFQVFDEAARLPAAVVDLVTSAATKQRTISGPNPVAVGRSSYEAATKGVKEAIEILKHGATERDLAKLDIRREVNSGWRIIDVYTNTIFRTLGAEDKIFRTYALRRSLEDQARVVALNEVRRGELTRGEVGRRTKELAQSPTTEMATRAIADAEVATFNNQGLIAGAAQKVRSHIGPGGRFAFDLLVPFTSTPSNVFTRLLEATPLGGAKAIGRASIAAFNKKFTPEEQRTFSETMGRSATGTALIYLGYMLASKGLATGIRDDEQAKAERDKAAGRSSLAIRVGDTWHQVGAFSPLGNLVGIGASLYREEHQELKDESQRPLKIAAIAGKTMLEQPMLKGASALTDTLSQPTRSMGSLLRSTAGSFIPTAISDVGILTDDRRREPRTVGDAVKARLPLLRRSVPEAIDVFGRPLESRRTFTVDPTLGSTAQETRDPLMRELVRLDVGVSKSRRKPEETEGQYRARIVAEGQAMEKAARNLIRIRSYLAMNDEEKREALKEAFEDAKKSTKPPRGRTPRKPVQPRTPMILNR